VSRSKSGFGRRFRDESDHPDDVSAVTPSVAA
jgi:hypothetical protein